MKRLALTLALVGLVGSAHAILMVRNETEQPFCYNALADAAPINPGPQFLAAYGYLGFPDTVTLVTLLPYNQCDSSSFVPAGQGINRPVD